MGKSIKVCERVNSGLFSSHIYGCALNCRAESRRLILCSFHAGASTALLYPLRHFIDGETLLSSLNSKLSICKAAPIELLEVKAKICNGLDEPNRLHI
jgi:hypothetical protein